MAHRLALGQAGIDLVNCDRRAHRADVDPSRSLSCREMLSAGQRLRAVELQAERIERFLALRVSAASPVGKKT